MLRENFKKILLSVLVALLVINPFSVLGETVSANPADLKNTKLSEFIISYENGDVHKGTKVHETAHVEKYLYPVKSNVDKLNLKLKTENEKAKVEVKIDRKLIAYNQGENFEINLEPGTKAVTAEVVAEDGRTKKTYSLIMQRKYEDSKFTVSEFLPAPGQFVNKLDWGQHPWKVEYGPWEDFLPGGVGVSLGSFGGYIVLEFDEPIKNDPNNPFGMDFIIYGNAFKGNEEPGGVQVKKDANSEWIELAGSEHYEDETIRDYEVTYTNNDPEFTKGNINVPWKDNQGNSGAVLANPFHLQSYFPNPEIYNTDKLTVSPNELTYSGVKLNTRKPTFGYVDVDPKEVAPYNVATNPYTVGETKGTPMDLEWAVDDKGLPVEVDEVKYVKIYNSMLLDAGAVGEVSPEVTGASIVKQVGTVGKTEDLKSITVNTSNEKIDFEVEKGKSVYDVKVTSDEVKVSADSDANNLYINNLRTKNKSEEKTIILDDESNKVVRIISQNGNNNPEIYYLNISKEDVEVDEVDKLKLDALIKRAKAVDLSNKTEESIETLNEKLDLALIVLQDEQAKQIEVDDAENALQLALDNLEEKLSNNAELSSLKINPGNYEVELKSNQSTYDYAVDNNIEEIDINAISVDSKATIKIGNEDVKTDQPIKYKVNEGRNNIVIKTTAADGKTSKNITLVVYKDISNTASRIKEFLPAPGQFVNKPAWGSNPRSILNGGTGVSLGSFGGYVTFEFDEAISDNPNNAYGVDMIIYGNGFKGNEEPAGVQVMDESGNWFDIAGSEHYEDETIKDYQVTYTNPDPSYEKGVMDVPYTDNQGVSGVVKSNTFHKQPWFPNPSVYNTDTFKISNETLTYSGVKLNTRTPKFGYVDVYPNGKNNNEATNPYKTTQSGTPIDLAWAVDKNGKPAKVNKVKQVKVYTNVLMNAGAFGEVSAEVTKILKTNPSEDIGETKDLDKLTLKYGEEVSEIPLEAGKESYEIGIDADSVTISATGDAENLFINNESLLMEEASKEISLTEGEKTVRVIAQNAEDNPIIYYLNLTKKEPLPEVNKEELSTLVEEVDALNTDGKTQESIEKLSEALASAKRVLALEEATQEEVDNEIKKLTLAVDNLVEIKEELVDKVQLETTINWATSLEISNKTEESINALNNVLASAKLILANDDATQEQVDNAVKEIKQSVINLEDIPKVVVDKSLLMKIKNELIETKFEDYTESSANNLQIAIAKAEVVILNEDATEQDVNQAIEDLNIAFEGLEKNETPVIPTEVNKVILQTLLKEVKSLELDNKTEDSIAVLYESIKQAELILGNEEATQEEIDNAVKNVQNAITNLKDIPKAVVDKSLLEALLDEISELDLEGFTEESAEDLEIAFIEAVMVFIDDESTQDEIDEQIENLLDKLDQLVERDDPVDPINPIEKVNKEVLTQTLDKAKKIKKSSYTEASYQDLAKAIEQAEIVLSNNKASQIEVDKAVELLNKVLKSLKLKEKPIIKKPNSNTESIKKPVDNNAKQTVNSHEKPVGKNGNQAIDKHVKVDKTKDKLPNTSTSLFTYLMLGLLLIAFGLILYLVNRKKYSQTK